MHGAHADARRRKEEGGGARRCDGVRAIPLVVICLRRWELEWYIYRLINPRTYSATKATLFIILPSAPRDQPTRSLHFRRMHLALLCLRGCFSVIGRCHLCIELLHIFVGQGRVDVEGKFHELGKMLRCNRFDGGSAKDSKAIVGAVGRRRSSGGTGGSTASRIGCDHEAARRA